MKANVYKSSSSKRSRAPKNKLNTKWFVIGGIVLVALVGIIAIRVSQAAIGDISGRFPEDNSEPHIDYTYNTITQKAVLKKSTNGETRTVTGLDNAYAEGQKMYDEMIAAQQPRPAPAPTPTPAPKPTPTPSTPNTTPTPSTPNAPTPDTSNTTNPGSTDTNGTNKNSSGNSDGTTTVVKKFLINLRRKVSITPKVPENIGKISSVNLLIDGKEVAKSDASNYLIILDTTKLSNGEHTLTTQLLNTDGSVLYADSYPIKIDNSDSWVDRLLWIFGY